jgi:hypothetical protein
MWAMAGNNRPPYRLFEGMDAFYLRAADAIVVLHAVYVAFVVFAQVAILLGIALGWKWVRNFWFRTIHFLMMAIVVGEALGGAACPLTTWEDQLREAAGEPIRDGTFVGRICESVLFVIPNDQVWVWHCVFGAVVLLTLILAPPRRPTGPRWLVGPRNRR